MSVKPEVNQHLVFISNARCSFPWIVDPQVKKNDKGVDVATYNCDLLLPSNDPAWLKFMQECMTVVTEKWKENAQAAMQRIQSDRKTRCYFNGEERVNSKTFAVLDGYAGMVGITARSHRQPQIIRADGTQVDPTNTMELRAVASKIYGGCYVNAVVKPWAQQNDTGIGMRCDLIAIQFAKDGEAFGAGPVDTTGMFGAVADAAPAAANPFAPPASAMPAAPFGGGLPSFLQS